MTESISGPICGIKCILFLFRHFLKFVIVASDCNLDPHTCTVDRKRYEKCRFCVWLLVTVIQAYEMLISEAIIS